MSPYDGSAPETVAICRHCAAPIGGEARFFCCAGCEAAYEAVRGLGLDAFYERRRLDNGLRPLKPDADPGFDFRSRVKSSVDGIHELHLMVDGASCAACVWLIESIYSKDMDVVDARLNLSTSRLTIKWRGSADRAGGLAEMVSRLGFRLVPFDPSCLDVAQAQEETDLLRATGIAGFAAGNVMILSVAVWVGVDMGPATKDLLHWISALVGLPAIFYAGLPFYRSAIAALRGGRLNMDVPIAVGITMTAAMSLSETIRSGPYAYFDAALTLLFFLLAGRYLDRRARGRARTSATHLLAIGARAVSVISSDGSIRRVAPDEVQSGDTVLVASGERIGIDGRILDGKSSVDESIVTGEALPKDVGVGDKVYAGYVNLGPALRVETTASGSGTLLAEIVRMVEVAERGKSRFVAIAERVTRLYAPVVHVAALATFIGWYFWMAVDWQVAMLHAVATLIITCPCALGLAVPAVQTTASGRLMRAGILLKSATALERLAEVDTVVFDKTGTLTSGTPRLIEPDKIPPDELRLAASIAASSKHPLARALAGAVPSVPAMANVIEHPGAGLSVDGIRLGSRTFCGAEKMSSGATGGPEIWLRSVDGKLTRFEFADVVREDAARTIAELRQRGFQVELLSGDRPEVVAAVAGIVGIPDYHAGVTPAQKAEHLVRLLSAGRKALMVGDGLNDAPALTSAHASLSPASGADIAQVSADAVFQGTRLSAVIELLDVALTAKSLVKQNIAMSIAYNALAVPLAIIGMVTPPIAAALMSSSSIAVVANALRLGRGGVKKWTR